MNFFHLDCYVCFFSNVLLKTVKIYWPYWSNSFAMKSSLLHTPNAYRFRNFFPNGLKYSEETVVDGEFSCIEVVLVKNMIGF